MLKVANFREVGVTLRVKGESINFISPDIAYFINLDSILIETYTNTTYEPELADIRFEDGLVPTKSPKSQFTVLSDFSVNLDENIGGLLQTSAEFSEISRTNMGFHILG